MKSYTDIDQSKKLAEILPLESADAFYVIGKEPVDIVVIYGFVTHKHLKEQIAYKRAVPCWSLAALLSVIPGGQVNRMANSDKWEASSWIDSDYLNAIEPAYYVEDYDNPVDACVAMIEKLHKLKLL